MRVLGIDLGLKHTGLCWRDGDEPRSLLLSPTFAAETVATRDTRVSYIVSSITRLVEHEADIEWVWVEGWAFGHLAGRGNNMTGTIEMGGALKYELHRRFGLHARSVPVATARLLVFGKGNLKKAQAVERARDEVGKGWSDDELDAYVIMRAGELATASKDGWWGKSSAQQKALDRLRASAGIVRQKGAA